ncbi:MAG: carboxylesterase/lipase family protein [Actinomycetota bacterium]
MTAPADINRYYGIRFARATRFEAPVREPFAGVPTAEGVAGPMAPQVPGMLERLLGGAEIVTDEDCLFLNVFTPTNAHEGSTLPVLVWIHGGAYLNGSGSGPWYEGSQLARRGTVVVTINYRLGALGFLGADNWGTLDQICALEWVRDNIGAFGGDAGNVTIFGESAGGSAVLSLMAAPSAAGLFHRVVAQSPSIRQLRTVDVAHEWERAFLDKAGASTRDDLRSLPVDQILAAQSEVIRMESRNYDMFSPAAGGSGLADDILKGAATNPVPLVIGTTRDESRLFTMFDPQFANCDADQWNGFLTNYFADRSADARSVFETHREGCSPAQLVAAVQTEHSFRQPAISLAEQRALAGSPTWMYWFTWASTAFGGILGSCHALDIPFAFDNLDAPGIDTLLGEHVGKQGIATRFADEITEFAAKGHAAWPSYDPMTRATLRIDEVCEVLDDPESAIRNLF